MIRYAAACIVIASMLPLSPALPIWAAAPASSEGREIHGDVPAGTRELDLGKLSSFDDMFVTERWIFADHAVILMPV